MLLDQRLAQDRPICAGSDSDSAEQNRDRQDVSPRWMPCLENACSMVSLSETAAKIDCLQPIIVITILVAEKFTKTAADATAAAAAPTAAAFVCTHKLKSTRGL